MKDQLIQKYNVPGPRYTSYPTVPYWDPQTLDIPIWKKSLQRSFSESNQSEGISLYIHLPFCESMCTFCGCNKRITKRHSVEDIYLDYLEKEWGMYLSLFDKKPIIKELHLGGGTPTFFSAKNLERLIKIINTGSIIHAKAKFSLEGHPNYTSHEQLKTLSNLGFKRISFGVQDYDKKVQIAIHRIQSFEQVKTITEQARSQSFDSICHDLIYGLPFQTMAALTDTIAKTISIRPDRIALYSYAHVPWIKGNGQRGFKEDDIPKDAEKRSLYEYAKKALLKEGYVEIGMDHFALPSDDLYISMQENTLHRNFMGYSDSKTQLMIGLGVSSISDSWYSFAQNEKKLEDYYARIDKNELPIFRGHHLNEEDIWIRRQILNIMCQMKTDLSNPPIDQADFNQIINGLEEVKKDGFILIENEKLLVKEEGKPFIRNICMSFDLLLKRAQPNKPIFSLTI